MVVKKIINHNLPIMCSLIIPLAPQNESSFPISVRTDQILNHVKPNTDENISS